MFTLPPSVNTCQHWNYVNLAILYKEQKMVPVERTHTKNKPEIYKGAYLAAITLTNLPTYLRPAEFSGMN